MPNRTEHNSSTFLDLIRRSERGKLKVYLGYAPGVGKTYLMLQEAHRLRQEGIDVVVGFVETHGRQGTADLLVGLEMVPRREIAYRGMTLEEMDLDAILTRRPRIALVDELAHTNPPGSRNPKRYMDVEDLLSAGIHVISTMNVQHLESLYNTVEGLVSVKVTERIPDLVLKQADEIVNVDLSPEDLVKRLMQGRIYPPERTVVAAENYFQPTRLEQLRELTLRETASQIDFKRRERPEETAHVPPDQVVVCLSASGPNNANLLRYGSRLAGRLNRRWYAVHVQTPAESPLKIESGRQRMLADTLTLANQLGAMVFTLKGPDVVDTILRFAREYRVGHIVIGRSGPSALWRRLLGRRSNVERLIEKGVGLRIVVLDERIAELVPAMQPPTKLVSKPTQNIATREETGLGSKIDRVVIWSEPITKTKAIADLHSAIVSAHPHAHLNDTYRSVIAREEEMSTFLNEGIAVPHACVESLDRTYFALGVPQAGISDVDTNESISVVLLALYPPKESPQYLETIGQFAKAVRDRAVQERLKRETTPEDVLSSLSDSQA